jgi:hypothetical protein
MQAAEKKGIAVDAGNAQWVAFWKDHRQHNGMGQPFGEEVLSLN